MRTKVIVGVLCVGVVCALVGYFAGRAEAMPNCMVRAQGDSVYVRVMDEACMVSLYEWADKFVEENKASYLRLLERDGMPK